LSGERKSAGGFFWRFVGSDVQPRARTKSTKRRPVQQIRLETGNVLATYRSMGAAGDAVGVDRASIRDAATGISSKTSAGYGWKFVELVGE